MYSTKYDSQIGELMLASDGNNLIGLWMDGQKYHGGTLFEEYIEKDSLPVFIAVKKWLDKYFAGQNPPIKDIAIAPIGKKYQKDIWDELCKIPYGETTSYGMIRDKVARIPGNENLTNRVTGGAIGRNPISVIIPCHRVVGYDGNLTGYAGGIDRKIRLLEIEGADMSRLYKPKEKRPV